MSEPLEPLRFERHFVEKVWGGTALARRPGIPLPEGVRVGETWEVVDRAAENSVVAVGALRGRTLREVMEEHGPRVLGSAPAGKEGRFPLLVKYLDASADLSVQVHPDAAAAAELGAGAEAKTEAWYVLDADPGAALYVGLRDDVEPDELASVADGAGVVELLQRWDARAGASILLRGGTVHAIGAGVRILEVQENSDTTYRLWDWGRVGLDGQPRETHVAQALACTRFGAGEVGPRQAERPEDEDPFLRCELVRAPLFRMDELTLRAPRTLATDDAYRIYAVVDGAGWLHVAGAEHPWRLDPGDVWLLPAECGEHRLEPDAALLRVVDVAPGETTSG